MATNDERPASRSARARRTAPRKTGRVTGEAVRLHPEQSHPLPPDERSLAGRILRDACPRKAHGEWKEPDGRADPIDTLIASSIGRIPQLIPIRYGRMATSPFSFFRGAAAVMAGDLASTPISGPRLQVCGDCHLLNFGGFATPERRIAFDINDFDETAVGPWEWDVKRLATSFVLAGRSNGFNDENCEEAAWAMAAAYREWMGRYALMPILDAWYDSIDLQEVIDAIDDTEFRRYARNRLNRAVDKSASEKEFAKLAFSAGTRPRIKDEPPLIYHAADMDDEAIAHGLAHVYTTYLESLPAPRRVLLDRYKVADIAIKVVGIGSVGTECGIVLLMSGNGDPLFLQYKEARASVLEPYVGASPYANHGQRVVAGQQIMQAASDAFLGWTVSRANKHMYIRQLRDAKIKPEVEIMRPTNLRNFGSLCGRALARAHARSGDAVLLAGYLGNSTAFEDALADFASAYADQTERDHAALLAAIRNGRIEAHMED
ncbi:DUF2252 domain-containing protein [Uliginosibacterium sp. sgz301328]|uniref:DUF2252 domain-containing protein n=1 Tax=Uliginosibacterium sp. sgz301328 TaxID=3243764 RepID=UPI00359DF674